MENVNNFIKKYEELKKHASAYWALWKTLKINMPSLAYMNSHLAENVLYYDDLLTIDDEYPDKIFILGTTALIYHDLMIFGKGDNDDFDRESMGIEYLNAGIANGCTKCMLSMGEHHIDFSDDTKCNEAIRYFIKAMYLGNYDALEPLVELHKYNEKRDINVARELYEFGVQLKHENTIMEYASEYKNEILKDEKRAIELYEMAIELGNPYAPVALGNTYINFGRTEETIKKAIKLYELGVERGNWKGIEGLIDVYSNVENTRVDRKVIIDRDPQLALRLWEMAHAKNINLNYNFYKMSVSKYDANFVLKYISEYDMLCHIRDRALEMEEMKNEIARLKDTIEELQLRPPEKGGEIYENAKEHFDNEKQTLITIDE